MEQALLTTRLRWGQVAQILRDTHVGTAALTQAAPELLPLPVPQPPWRRPTFEAPKQPEPPRSISGPTSLAASRPPAPLDVWNHMQISELAKGSREAGKQQFVRSEAWLFLPAINCYEHVIFYGHAHGALSGMKGNIALGSILFCVHVIIKPEDWCSILARAALREQEWRHLLDEDDTQYGAHWFAPVLPERLLWPVVCTLRCHCQERDDPEPREDAFRRQGPLRLVRHAATYMLRLLSLVHDEGGDFDQKQGRDGSFLADYGGILRRQ